MALVFAQIVFTSNFFCKHLTSKLNNHEAVYYVFFLIVVSRLGSWCLLTPPAIRVPLKFSAQ